MRTLHECFSSDEAQAFVNAIHSKPWDLALYLIYADWVEENGQTAAAEKLRAFNPWGILEREIDGNDCVLTLRTYDAYLNYEHLLKDWKMQVVWHLDIHIFDGIPF